MSSIRIWSVESDYDEKAVKILATKLASYLNVHVTIQTAGLTAYNRVSGKPGQLEKAVEIFLKQDDCLIFVVDTDSEMSLKEKRRHRKSFISLRQFGQYLQQCGAS